VGGEEASKERDESEDRDRDEQPLGRPARNHMPSEAQSVAEDKPLDRGAALLR
jgi:hypothetical protein